MIITKSEPFTKDKSKLLKEILGALAVDLNRVALGINRGSRMMAERFYEEAIARKAEINSNEIPAYITKIILKIDKNKKLDEKFAEEILVYSTLIENFVTQKLK